MESIEWRIPNDKTDISIDPQMEDNAQLRKGKEGIKGVCFILRSR